MVRLHTSFLALTFATGLVLASSDDYQRRDELFERDLDVEEFFGRQYDLLDERGDIFDEPEARNLFSGLFKVAEKEGEKVAASAVKGSAKKIAKPSSLRRLGNQLKPSRSIMKQLKPSRSTVKQLKPTKKRMVKELKRAAKQANKNSDNNDNQNNGNPSPSPSQNNVNQDLERARQEVANADRNLPPSLQFQVQSRGLEDDEELSRRDLDAELEEVFGREYYDDLD